jgi:hypothetical protein
MHAGTGGEGAGWGEGATLVTNGRPPWRACALCPCFRSCTAPRPTPATLLPSRRSVPTSRLLRALRKHEARLFGSPAGGLLARIKWGCQLRARPPAFAFFLRGGQAVTAPEERFLAGLLRRLFDLEGVPLRLTLK